MPPEKSTISDYPIKPRRTRGTYTYKFRNRVTAVLLTGASLIGVGYCFLPTTSKLRDYLHKEYFIGQSEEFKVRKRRLAPFTIEGDEEAALSTPVIIDPATAKSVRTGMAFNDPLLPQPSQ